MKKPPFSVDIVLVILLCESLLLASDSSASETETLNNSSEQISFDKKNVSSTIRESYELDDEVNETNTNLIEIPTNTKSSGRQYPVAGGYGGYSGSYGIHSLVDFSPLFLALIPIALFLGAAAAFALSVATSSSTAVASAQQQQQQEENNNNNNAANSNNNNALALAALMASFNNNYNSQTPTFIIVNNATSLASLFGSTLVGRSFDSESGWSRAVDRWINRQRRRYNRQRDFSTIRPAR